MQCFN